MPRPPLTAPGVPAPLVGFDYPAPRFPRYLLQERTDDIEELMPLARGTCGGGTAGPRSATCSPATSC